MNQRLTNRVYWVSTGFLSVLMLLDGSLFVIHSQSFLEDIRRLGYPEYLLTMMGIAKLAGAPVLLYQGVPRLKEWAYAGFTFVFGAAAISHTVCGDTLVQTLPAIFCASLLAVSYLTYRARSRQAGIEPAGAASSSSRPSPGTRASRMKENGHAP